MSNDTLRTELHQSNQEAGRGIALAESYFSLLSISGKEAAEQWLMRTLHTVHHPVWLQCLEFMVARNDAETFIVQIIEAALARFPAAIEFRYSLGQMTRSMGDNLRAEGIFRSIIALQPDHRAATLALAGLLRENGRINEACKFVLALAETITTEDVDLILVCMAFLRECQKTVEALRICNRYIASGWDDERLQFWAGELSMATGDFGLGRKHFELFLSRSNDLMARAFALQAITDMQRYADGNHPDFQSLKVALESKSLPRKARAALLFATGKACDDIAEYDSAAQAWREANELAAAEANWSAVAWKTLLDSQLVTSAPSFAIPPINGFTPVFIVGMPRSGTTLAAQMLSNEEQIQLRGELNLIPYIWDELTKHGLESDPKALFQASRLYFSHVRQDDAEREWYIDKNPLNFKYLKTIFYMFPNAKIIYSDRNSGDVALSLWSHYFAKGQCEFAYDLSSIGSVIKGCRQLIQHWGRILPMQIYHLKYERLIVDTANIIGELRDFLGISNSLGVTSVPDNSSGTITSSSRWQARQAVYRHSIGRWRHYANAIPELRNLVDL